MKFIVVASLLFGIALGAPKNIKQVSETLPYTVVATHNVGDQSVSFFIKSSKIPKFGCSTAALKQQMALNFELVVNDQLFTVVLASCK